MPNIVEELLEKPIPQEVWHYTSLAGLEGILTSGKIWATDARFTNDRTEFVLARQVAEEYLRSVNPRDLRGGMPLETISSMLARAFDEGALSPSETEVYLISFSEVPDLLSQWHQYADASKGVSIAFDLRYIRPPKQAEIAVTFAPCVYEVAEQRLLIAAALSHFSDKVREFDLQTQDTSWMRRKIEDWNRIQRIYGLPQLPSDRIVFEENLQRSIADELLLSWRKTLYDLLRVASHCKSDAFAAEREWRLALPRPTRRAREENPILFRGPNGNIPYFASNLFHEGRLPITSIRTGPLCTGIDRVRSAMNQNGYQVPIIQSVVPLRDPRAL